MRSITFARRFGNAHKVVAARDLPHAECTVLELLLQLEPNGWTWQQLPKPTHRPAPYVLDGRKVWYSSGPNPFPEYLVALLDLPRLAELGIV